jgi:hypothetical protein
LRLTRRLRVRQHQALRQRLIPVGDPDLKVHGVRPSNKVMGRSAENPGLLHVFHRLHPAVEQRSRMAHEEDGQRQAYPEVAHEVDERRVDVTGLGRLRVGAAGLVVDADGLAVEEDERAGAVALLRLDPEPIRAAQGECPHLVPLDLVARRLDRVV